MHRHGASTFFPSPFGCIFHLLTILHHRRNAARDVYKFVNVLLAMACVANRCTGPLGNFDQRLHKHVRSFEFLDIKHVVRGRIEMLLLQILCPFLTDRPERGSPCFNRLAFELAQFRLTAHDVVDRLSALPARGDTTNP